MFCSRTAFARGSYAACVEERSFGEVGLKQRIEKIVQHNRIKILQRIVSARSEVDDALLANSYKK